MKNNHTITLGPVANLESHVNPEWWRYIFNSLYIKTDADVVDDDNITKHEIDLFLKIINADKSAHILDVCCGQGRHSFELYKRNFTNVEGLDRSRYLISKAKNINKRNGFSVKFKEGDARSLPYAENSFDVVMLLGNSFGYFESADDDLKVLKSISKILKPNGKLLIDVADGDFLKQNFQPRSWEWIDKKHFVCRERSLSSNEKKLISREVITHAQKGIIADQFYAENLYSKQSLKELLGKANFDNVIIHQALAVQSQRNQDLGMMKNRIILTGINHKNCELPES
ncbi:MAG: class I SAM-dependent methyltransferase [Chitinophagaceae bacterium]